MSAERVIDRTRRRKSEGANQSYPNHAKARAAGDATKTALAVFKEACPHLGESLPRKSCGPTLYRCKHFGDVTTRIGACSDAQRSCARCALHPVLKREAAAATPAAFPPTGLEWVTAERLAADSVRLASLLPRDVVGIVGLPRSGMIPASIISAYLHLPLYELTHEGELRRLGHGSRGRDMGYRFPRGVEAQTGRLAVIDDTVYGGAAMRRAREAMTKLGRPAVFAAVYSRLQALPESEGAADLFAAALPTPHLLAWNMPNNGPFAGYSGPSGLPFYRAGVALDFDGIVVHDAESAGKIGEAYLVPRTHPCRLIVTGRRERSRAATAAHLRALGVEWDRLEMLPDEAPDDSPQTIAKHKARHYASSECGFFFESDPLQAELIHHLSGKPVVCPRTAQVWHADMHRTPPAPLLPLSAVAPVFAPLVGRKVSLVHSPTTGNAGDRLLERAAEQLLTRFGIEYQVTEPDAPGDADVICLFAGGNYGHRWCKTEAARRAAAIATGLPCVLLPQTAYGPEPWTDYRAAFVRDVPSLAHVPGATLAPDLALCYQPERPLPPAIHTRLDAFIRGHEGRHAARGVDPRAFAGTGPEYLEWVASHAEVHTDALHVAICGLIARRRVTLYPTDLHKQRGVWELWLKDLGCAWGG